MRQNQILGLRAKNNCSLSLPWSAHLPMLPYVCLLGHFTLNMAYCQTFLPKTFLKTKNLCDHCEKLTKTKSGIRAIKSPLVD